MKHGDEEKQARFLRTGDTEISGFAIRCQASVKWSPLLHELCWELFPFPTGHLFLSRDAGGQMVMAKVDSVPSLYQHCAQHIFGFFYFPQ